MLFFIRREEPSVMDRTHKCAVNGSSTCWHSPKRPPATQRSTPLKRVLVHFVLSMSVCGELLDLALQAVVLAIRFHGSNRVVVGCPRLKVVHAHAEHG